MEQQPAKRGIFNPKIVAFVCNWCSSASGDLVGPIRAPYRGVPRILRVLCSGRIMADNVLEAMEMGADGVFVAGCDSYECNYRDGNFIAKRRMHFAKNLLKFAGFDPGRVQISLGFLQLISDPLEQFRKKILKLGPLGQAETENFTPEDVREKLMMARKVTQDPEIGWMVGKENQLTEIGNTYDLKISQQEFDEMIIDKIKHKYRLYAVLGKIDKIPMTIPEIAKQSNFPEPEVFNLIQELEHSGMVNEAGLSGRYFQYIQA